MLVYLGIILYYLTLTRNNKRLLLTRSSGGFVTEKNTFPKKSHTALVRRSSSTDSLIVLYRLCYQFGVGVAIKYY